MPDPAAYLCEADPWGPSEFSDVDHVCTFAHDGVEGYLYIQATPISCESSGMSYTPVFTTRAWLSVEGVVAELSDPLYDHGGNHNNDLAELQIGGTNYRLWHSSFGWGWRRCQEMDCLIVLGPSGATCWRTAAIRSARSRSPVTSSAQITWRRT